MSDHQRDHADPARWAALRAGQRIVVVKLAPDTSEAARYDATVVGWSADRVWLGVRAEWTFRRYELDGLVFAPGDELIEWFSPHRSFNAFGVIAPDDGLRGWYANATYPAYLRPVAEGESPVLVWHDLYLDLVGLPDGSFVIRDEDELHEARLDASEPALHAEILAAATEMTACFQQQAMPFQRPSSSLSSAGSPPIVLQ